MQDIEIIQANCLDRLRLMPNKSVDLILTDIPYGIGIHRMNFVKSGPQKIGKATRNDYRTTGDWDTPLDSAVLDEIKRVAKTYVVWGGNYVPFEWGRQWLVWDKRIEDKYQNDYSDCELATTSIDGPSRIFRYMWSGFLRGDNSFFEKRYHPTQKPVALMQWCIELFTQPGDTVLDCFSGSGTTAVACYRTRRKCIAIEISPEYCQIARQRIQDEHDKLILFNEKIG
jgi:DNA modification methylase